MNSSNGNNNSDDNSRNSCGNSSGSNSVGNNSSNSNKKINSNNKVITFGCRLNACESEIIDNFIQELGLDNFTIINTCAVTAEAERKLRQTIRKLHYENNEIKIILTGCAVALHADEYMKMDGVVGIISNDRKLVKDEYQKYRTDEHLTSSIDKVRGFLQIQNGCDNKCTYCVVRITRGPNVSFAKEDIVRNARHLLDKGYKEIVLTGVNISSYGQDYSNSSELAHLIRHILKEVPELHRLRLSSLDPADINQDLLDIIQNEPRLMPHIHESIQSGDNMILKRMLRRHTREQVIELNQKLIEIRPEVIIGADIIAGFPTETDEMFQNTKNFLKEANISLLHAFPYSKRPGTPAASMPQVQNKIKHQRAKELRDLAKSILCEKLNSYVGQTFEILAETKTAGKSNNYLPVKSSGMTPGEVYQFKCTRVENNVMIGEIL